ncbi:MAG: FAD:protein FMN transferase [Planctomycetota bacterium]
MNRWWWLRQSGPALIGGAVLGLYLFFTLGGTSPEGLTHREALVMGPISMNLIFDHGEAATEPAQDIVEEVLTRVRRINALMSSHVPSSDISRLNQLALGKSQSVHPLTWKVLMEARRYAILSSGAFDPTVGPLIRLYDFKQEGRERWTAETFPAPEAVRKAKGLVGLEAAFSFDLQGRRVTRRKEGSTLDLGAIAKGFAVDVAIDCLREHGIRHASVEIGGEVRLLGSHPEGRPWTTGIQDPARPDTLLHTLKLRDTAIATSGSYQQHFIYQGKRYSHILDPRSGLPVESQLVGVTILAPTCLQADALATAVSVLGVEEAKTLLDPLSNITAYLQVQSEAGEIETLTVGRPIPLGPPPPSTGKSPAP